MGESVTFTTTIKRSDIPAKLIDKLKKLEGLPPYNGPSNIVRNDGYFAASIEQEFGSHMVQAAQELVIRPMRMAIDNAIADAMRNL